jgi:hypothetical protein
MDTHVRRMDRSRLPNAIMKYQPEAKRNAGRPLKGLWIIILRPDFATRPKSSENMMMVMMKQVFLWNLIVAKLVNKFYAFYGIKWFIAVFTTSHPQQTEFVPLPRFMIRVNIALRQRVNFSSLLFPVRIRNIILYTFLSFPTCAKCPNHLILWLVTRIIFGKKY